jgi:iron complex transport system ATP-binding protein
MTKAIEIDEATVIRSGREVLKGVSLRLGRDERACILGPNGSGKSSIVKLISGELSPLYREPAAIRLFGQETWDLFALRSRLGIVSDTLQQDQARDESVLVTILSGFFGGVGIPLRTDPSSSMIDKAREVAELLGLQTILDRKASELSSGQMRRVLVARALVHEPEMLLLDEPYASLDIAARYCFRSCVSSLVARGHAIILVTHELSEISPEIERVILMKDGQVFADGPKAEILRTDTISELFGLSLLVTEEGGLYHAQLGPARAAIPKTLLYV